MSAPAASSARTSTAHESGVLAEEMKRHILGVLGVPQVVHCDGARMTAKTFARLFGDLGVTRSQSRREISYDHARSE